MVTFRIDDEVTLREFRLEDAAAIYAVVMENYDHLRNFMHWITSDYSLESARSFVSHSIKSREDRENLGFGIFRQGRLIGSIGFTYFDWKAMKTEVGYWIAADEQGKGIVSAACSRLIDFAFSELGMNRIEIRCSAENERSSAIPKRFGFLREGYLRSSEFRNGRLHDFEIYGLLAEDWKARKK